MHPQCVLSGGVYVARPGSRAESTGRYGSSRPGGSRTAAGRSRTGKPHPPAPQASPPPGARGPAAPAYLRRSAPGSRADEDSGGRTARTSLGGRPRGRGRPGVCAGPGRPPPPLPPKPPGPQPSRAALMNGTRRRRRRLLLRPSGRRAATGPAPTT
jgi:hypothetical protein